MRKSIFLLIIFANLFGIANAQWNWQNPLPQGNPLDDIYIFNENTAIAVGQSGTILKTTNGGASWTSQASGTTVWLHSVCFADNNTGWVVGANGTILKTTDGGTSWTDQSNFIFTDNLTSVYCINADIGWVVGATSGIKKTTDGGTNWSMLSGSPSGGEDVQFIDSNTGWLASGHRTTNGGLSWTWSNTGIAECHSLHFLDANTGWAVGGSQVNSIGSIAKTTDGGLTWVQQTTPVTDMHYSVYFTDINTGWAVASYSSNTILKTTDGGTNWIIQTTLPSGGFSKSVRFANSNTGWVVGEAGRIFKTTDGGTNWFSQVISVTTENQYLHSVDFENDNVGWAIGRAGQIIKTTDGGTTWLNQTSGVTTDLNSVHFIDLNTGWVVGSSGVILKTTDGGTSWSGQASGITNSLKDVYFIDGSTGWVVGLSGKILKTTNGGTTWVSQTSGVTALLNSVYFIDGNTGIAVGSSAKVLRTTNGGTTWTNTTLGTPTTIIYYSVHFADATTGWLVGSSGRIYKTTNAGTSWSQQTSGTGWTLYSVNSVGGTVRAVGQSGLVLKTIDGGTNWTSETSGAVTTLYSVSFVNDTTGWAVGMNGTILHKGIPPATQPVAFNVIGGGSYCQGGDGLPVGLSDSEIDVTYTLFKDAVAQVPTVSGTGDAISFGNQLFGTYTVSGTNTGGTTEMTGSAVITETATLPVSVSVEVDQNNVCSGTPVTLTATPVNGGNPAYQWYKNGSPVGSDQDSYAYTPENNDQVYVVMTSDLGCVSDNPATSNTISMLVNDLLQVNVNIVADQNNVCEGTQVIFTASPVNGGNPSYQWYVNGSTVGSDQDTYTYTPDDGDQVYVIMTSDLGCVSDNPATSNTISMLVNDILPVNASIVADQNDVCEGTQVIFTASPVNGGNPSYQWYVNGSTVGSDQGTYTFTPDDGDQVYVVMTSDLSCVSDNPATSNTVTMIVNDILPVSVSIVADQNNVCEGTIVSFFPIPVEGGSSPTYEWYVNGTFAANGDTYSYVPLNGDQVYVIMTSSLACVSSNPSQSNTIQMQVSQYIDVTASIAVTQNNLCEGSEFNFTSSTTGGGNTPQYQWKVNGATTGENTPEFAYVAENGDVVSLVFTSCLTCTNENPVTSNTITTIVNPLPVVTWPGFEPDTLCIEDWGPVTLTGGTPAGGTYSGDGVVDNLFDPAQAGTGTHEITYTYSDPNGCSNQSSLLLFVDVCLGMSEKESGLLVYPNPVSDNLMVKMKDNSSIQQITLTNMLGIRVYQNENPDSNKAVSIPVQNLPSGNYLLRVISDSKTVFKQVIIR